MKVRGATYGRLGDYAMACAPRYVGMKGCGMYGLNKQAGVPRVCGDER